MAQRYDLDLNERRSNLGDWVRASDHEEEVRELETRITELEKELEECQQENK